jgi:thiol:disulfide interchange protein DsbC
MKKPALMNQLLSLAALLLLAIGCSSGMPTQADAAGMSVDDATAVLQKFDPSIKVMSVEEAPIPGLWEAIVTVKGEVGIVYISAEKKHVLLGSIVDVNTKDNLTKQKFEAVKGKYEPKADFGSIPLDDAVVLGDPKAKHKVIVFDDPD